MHQIVKTERPIKKLQILFILQTVFVKTTGTISITFATVKWLHAITGTTAIEHVA